LRCNRVILLLLSKVQPNKKMNTYLPGSPPESGAGNKSDNTLKFVLFGCLGSTIVSLILVAFGAYYIWQNSNWFIAKGVRMVAVTTVDQFALPEEDREGVVIEIDRVVDQYLAGHISHQDLSAIMEKIAQSPILPIGMVYFAEQQYLVPARLDQAEHRRASRNLERLARGIFERKIPQERIEHIVSPIMDTKYDGTEKLKERLTDHELRALLERVAVEVDQAKIPDEPFEVEIVAELRMAIDQSLQEIR